MRIFGRKAMLLACVGGASCAAAPAFAAPDPAAAQVEVEQVVVTARRVSENQQTVPIAVSTLTSAQLRQETVTTIRDLQGQAPSLFISTGLGGPSAASVSLRAQTQADTLLTTDPSVGVYLNSVDLPRQVGLRSAMYDVDQIEVLKGPQGTLFGKNTTGGALVITTKRPTLSEYGGFGQVTLGDYQLFQFVGAVNAPVIPDKLALRLAVNRTTRGGFGNQGAGQGTSNQNENGARLSLLYTPTDNVSLYVTADTARVRAGGPLIRVTGFNPAAPQFGTLLLDVATELGLSNPSSAASRAAAFNAWYAATTAGDAYHNTAGSPQAGHLDLGGVSADLSVRFSGLTFRSITAERESNRDDSLDYDTTPFTIVAPEIIQDFRSFTQEVQLLNDPSERFSWIVGAFYSHEGGSEGSKAASLGAINPNISIADTYVVNESTAAFGQANYHLTKTIRLTAGVRYTTASEHVTLRNRNERPLGVLATCTVPVALIDAPCTAHTRTRASDPTYLASIDWQPRDGLLLYVRTASSFRAGGLNTKTTANAPASAAPFAPEKTRDYEAGLKGDFWERRLRINADAYHTDYSNVQRSTVDFVDGALIARTTNAAKATVDGVEVETTVRPTAALTLRASGNWTHAKYQRFVDVSGDRTHEKFPVPEFQAQASASYVVPTAAGDLTLHTSYRWQDDVNLRPFAKLQSTVTQQAFGVWDARASLDVRAYDMQVAVYIKNIDNKTYKTACETFDTTLGYNFCWIGEPRTVGLEVRKSFGGG